VQLWKEYRDETRLQSATSTLSRFFSVVAFYPHVFGLIYTSALQSAKGHPSEAAQAAVKEIENTRDLVELELQKSQLLLDTTKGISVKIPPNRADQ